MGARLPLVLLGATVSRPITRDHDIIALLNLRGYPVGRLSVANLLLLVNRLIRLRIHLASDLVRERVLGDLCRLGLLEVFVESAA